MLLKFYSGTQGIEYAMKGNVQKAVCFHCLQLSQTDNKAGSHKKGKPYKMILINIKKSV